MLRRAWQSSMIAMARSPWLKQFGQQRRASSELARNYVAGADVRAGLERAFALWRDNGLRSSLFYLGEYVDDLALVNEAVRNKIAIVDALSQADLDVHVSVDPTQIGQLIDAERCRENAREIARHVRKCAGNRAGVHCMMLDMEDDTLVDPTLSVHDELRKEGLPVGVTAQAYLRRTEADLETLVRMGARVRLVRGAFVGNSRIAFTDDDEIKESFRYLIARMFSPEAKAKGFYPTIATHDDRIQSYAISQARRYGWAKGSYEFEMLLGVRGSIAEELARSGERVRLYVPFGKDWWPYAVRRVGESPRNARLMLRSLLSRE